MHRVDTPSPPQPGSGVPHSKRRASPNSRLL
jgi:hypothetical protein